MKQASYMRILSLSILCGLLACSTTTHSAIKWDTALQPTWKKAGALVLAAAIGRMVTKDMYDASDIQFKQEVKKLNRSIPLSPKWWKQLFFIIDTYLIGYPGKDKGFKIAGKTVSYTGQKELLGNYINENDLKINVYAYNGIKPYGLLGTTWAYLQPLVSAIKFLKDVDDVSTYIGVFDAVPNS